MADEASLRLIVQTPHATVFDDAVQSLRVPVDTGQVGLRPHAEPAVLVVEPGLIVTTNRAGERLLASAGGVLRCDGRTATLLTPLAVAGDDAGGLETELSEALRAPTAEIELRTVLQRLEAGLLVELRGRPGDGSPRAHR